MTQRSSASDDGGAFQELLITSSPMRRGVRVVVLVMLAVLLASCGGSSSKPAASSSPVTPGTRQPTSSTAVAYVDGTPIPKASYEHWLAVERAVYGGIATSAIACLRS